MREHLHDLAAKLREVRDALEARDIVLLADMLRYEIPDTCQTWQGILKDMAANVAACAGGPSTSTPAR